jgi:tetratricopeptide (TPR) repeat protein
MRLLQEHSYQRAAAHFRNLLTSFPGERALLDRVRVYLDLCEREQRKMPAAPSSREERLTLATAALNDGNDDAAERLAQAVLNEDPDHDLALYLLAAVRSREGDAIAALELLRKAVQVSPDISAQARHDTDFEPLRQFSEFEQLLEPPTRNGHSEAKRARRGVSGR